jgi:hypothetical protein
MEAWRHGSVEVWNSGTIKFGIWILEFGIKIVLHLKHEILTKIIL